MSVRLYVKLPKAELEKEGFEKMFSDFEPSFTTKIIKERKKNECRGFGFVTVPTDEDADVFISKYNEQVFLYNGEAFKDENGSDFVLLIEKALPRTKGEKDDNAGDSESAGNGEEANTQEKTTVTADVPNIKPRRNEGKKANVNANANNNGGKKGRKGTAKPKTEKSVSVSESIQPDPRWASQLSKLKEMFTAQTSK